MGGIEYVYWDGARLTPWMKHCLEKLDADLRRLFGVHLVLDSSKGIRTEAEQAAIFLSRYRVQHAGSGPYGDVRWWNGTRYVRHSGLGTVAQPGTSNHEIQGTTAAVDLADSGGAGIGTKGSARSNWLRANAANYGLIPEGFSFGEAWHYAVPNIFTPVPSGGQVAPTPAPVPKEDEMTLITWNTRVWLLSDEKVVYVRNDGASLVMAKRISKQSLPLDLSNDELTETLLLLAIPWAALDATYRNQAFDNESNWGKGTVWSRQIAEGHEDALRDVSLARSIEDLEKSVKAG